MDFLSRFKENVLKHPDAIAIRDNKKIYTYQEADQASDSIMQLLENEDVETNSVIGLMMNRNSDVVISILGILKYGCAFLPIDINFPKDRINYILNDSCVEFIISNIDDDIGNKKRKIKFQVYQVPKKKHRIPTVAYIIYTSGSTGNPKGVIIEYKSLTNVLESFSSRLAMCNDDKFYALTTISFDIAVLELLLPLYVGAQVIISNQRAQIDPNYLTKQIKKFGITIMQATPVTWKILIESGWKNFEGIKILCGGEAMSEELSRKLLEIASVVWNLYGPTETTIWSSAHRLLPGKAVSIGRPINNTIFKVMDKDLNETLEGELFIGGEGVAKGYWKRPELTEEKFIFIDGVRYYATGDIVRKIQDEYYYICRKDFQVKINGHRIELGEIETVLSRIPGIREAVVVNKGNILVAFVIEETETSENEIREILSKTLPEYMIPNEIKKVGFFPLTNNNKIDRKRLADSLTQKSINLNDDIYSQNLSSFEIMQLAAAYSSKGYVLSIKELYAGERINEALHKKENVKICMEEFDSVPAWHLQRLMILHNLLHPESNRFYEEHRIICDHVNAEEIYTRLSLVLEQLDIAKIKAFYRKGDIIWQRQQEMCASLNLLCEGLELPPNKKGELLQIVVYSNGEIVVRIHHALIDGESRNLLIDIIYKTLYNIPICIQEYNGFLKTTKELNAMFTLKVPYKEIKQIFTCQERICLDKIQLYQYTYSTEKLLSKTHQIECNLSMYLVYLVARAIGYFADDRVIFGCVNSGRLFMSRKQVLGNFININHMEFEKAELENVSEFVKRYKQNAKYLNYLYNEENNYEINVIINDYRNKANNEELECYSSEGVENNNFKINIVFDVGRSLKMRVSYRNITEKEKFSIFLDNLVHSINCD